LHHGLRVDARLAPGPWIFARQGVEAAGQKTLAPAARPCGDDTPSSPVIALSCLPRAASTTMWARST